VHSVRQSKWIKKDAVVTLIFIAAVSASVKTSAAEALTVEAVIALGAVNGRIDHLAVDVPGRRLFVAERNNKSVAVVDMDARKLIRTLRGFSEPQGVAFDPSDNTLYVTNGGDGSLRMYAGDSFASAGRFELGADADNIRLDPGSGRVLVGFGEGLAVIEPKNRAIRKIAFSGHPEAIQPVAGTSRVFVNVPDSHEVTIIDVESGIQGHVKIALAGANFPMALDGESILLPLRHPSRLLAVRTDGAKSGDTELCEDADDAFVDSRRGRVYVSCGEGYVDVFQRRDAAYDRVDHVRTASGARTSLFVPQWDRLLVAVPASASSEAAIWVMVPS
jgi:WD40 repeat protein